MLSVVLSCFLYVRCSTLVLLCHMPLCCLGGVGPKKINMSAGHLEGVVVRLEAAVTRLEATYKLPHWAPPLTSGQGTLAQYCKQLETLVGQIETKVGGGTDPCANSAVAAVAATAGTGDAALPAMLAAFDHAMEGPLAEFVRCSRGIGGVVEGQGVLLGQLFVHHRRLLRLAPQSAKPGPKVLDMLFEATNECVNAIQVWK